MGMTPSSLCSFIAQLFSPALPQHASFLPSARGHSWPARRGFTNLSFSIIFSSCQRGRSYRKQSSWDLLSCSHSFLLWGVGGFAHHYWCGANIFFYKRFLQHICCLACDKLVIWHWEVYSCVLLLKRWQPSGYKGSVSGKHTVRIDSVSEGVGGGGVGQESLSWAGRMWPGIMEDVYSFCNLFVPML